MTQESTQTDNGQDQGGTREVTDKQRTVAEWTTLAISVLIIIGMVGAASWLHFRGEELPPVVVVEPHLEEMRQDDSGYYVSVTITNTGDITVANAMVLGELDTGEEEPEAAEITVDFLAGGESVEGTLIFRSDPAQGDLTVGATSYQEP